MNGQTGTRTDRQTDRQTMRWKDRQPDRLADPHTGRQIDRQPDSFMPISLSLPDYPMCTHRHKHSAYYTTPIQNTSTYGLTDSSTSPSVSVTVSNFTFNTTLDRLVLLEELWTSESVLVPGVVEMLILSLAQQFLSLSLSLSVFFSFNLSRLRKETEWRPSRSTLSQ